MTSKRKRARRLQKWRAYQRRIDRLAPQAPTAAAHTNGCLSVIKLNQGYFRAEGWDTRGVHRRMMGHGA